jgi:hypothetical protein
MIFVSTMTYALGKQLGFPGATAEFDRQLAAPDTKSLPVVRLITRLRKYADVGIWHDSQSTCLGKTRARAFHAALEANPDVYFTVDDDCEADSETLGRMIEAATTGERNVVLAPCITRGSNVVNVALPPQLEWRELASGGRLVRCVGGGFGIVAMSGDTMRHLVDQHPDLHFFDDDNSQVRGKSVRFELTTADVPQIRKPALFFDLLEPNGSGENVWLGEDVAFLRRVVRAGVRLEALCTGTTSHAGQVLRLETVTELPELGGCR